MSNPLPSSSAEQKSSIVSQLQERMVKAREPEGREREPKSGDVVEICDADGEWHRAAAITGIEGTHDESGRKIHDFPIVWVGWMTGKWNAGHDQPEFRRMPWPAGSVRVVPPSPDDTEKLKSLVAEFVAGFANRSALQGERE